MLLRCVRIGVRNTSRSVQPGGAARQPDLALHAPRAARAPAWDATLYNQTIVWHTACEHTMQNAIEMVSDTCVI